METTLNPSLPYPIRPMPNIMPGQISGMGPGAPPAGILQGGQFPGPYGPPMRNPVQSGNYSTEQE
jgi:hypothetical protein